MLMTVLLNTNFLTPHVKYVLLNNFVTCQFTVNHHHQFKKQSPVNIILLLIIFQENSDSKPGQMELAQPFQADPSRRRKTLIPNRADSRHRAEAESTLQTASCLPCVCPASYQGNFMLKTLHD